MDIHASIREICRNAARKHGDDIPAAVDDAEKRVRKLPDFPEIVETLIRGAIQDAIYDMRRRDNNTARRQAGFYGPPPKVIPSETESFGRVTRSLYNYYLGGRTLGNLMGSELIPIAESESAAAAGHEFNARLLRALAPLVKDDKTVSQCVSEKRLRSMFKKLKPAEAVLA